MNGLVFTDQIAIAPPVPNRADIACFVGLVGRRESAVPDSIQAWLKQQGWQADQSLLNVPVPITNWGMFQHLFAWDQRDYGASLGAAYLGAAVRSFFAQGGRKCYVVRVGDPWSVNTTYSDRLKQIQKLIPGYPDRVMSSALDRRSWLGVGCLFGLPDASFLCLPDLAEAVSTDFKPLETERPKALPEQFLQCSEQSLLQSKGVNTIAAPRCDSEGFEQWAQALWLIVQLIQNSSRSAPTLREVQIVAAIPLPEPGTLAEKDLLGFLISEKLLAKDSDQSLNSAFLQLVYPWVQTPGSAQLPEQLESPEGVFAGLLARNALTRGSFRSATHLHLADVQRLYPVLTSIQLLRPHQDKNLLERVSMLGSTPSGFQLLSDVTTSLQEYRSANVNRLVNAIVKAARRLGEEVVFEASGEPLWTRLRESLNRLLLGLFQANALNGKTPEDAFDVRCDRTLMTQADIDNGRVIVQLQFVAAAPIEQITIVLAMQESGQVSLISTSVPEEEAA